MTSSSIIVTTWPSGPGFPLPSLSAESLALIAYFKLNSNAHEDAIKVSYEAAWDVSTSPNGRFPHLLCLCEKEFGGVAGIIKHMRQCNSIEGHADLDLWMNDDELADCFAWSSLLLSRATTLLDLYLFLTTENYITTRSAYTAFLPLYANYIIPPALHKAAEARTSHLSVAAILSSSNDETEVPSTALGTGIGKMGFGNARVKGIAVKAGRRLGLENAVRGLFAPLEELLGEKSYFFNDTKPSSLDALVLGYLGVIQEAEMPDKWAKEILDSTYPKLAKWVERNFAVVFDDAKVSMKSQ